jgi:hypothetical protein
MPINETTPGGLTPDEEMYVPAAVKRQLEAAQKLVDDQVEPGDESPAETSVETPVGEEAPQDVAPDPDARKREDWKHKYQVLKGKYDAEIPELTNRLAVIGSTVEAQTNLIADLQQRRQETTATPAPSTTPSPKLDVIDETEFEGYGESIVKLVRQLNALVKTGNAAPVAPTVDPGFEQRISRIEAQVVKTAEQEYYEALDRSVPDWKVVNKDPKFLTWLQQLDPITEIVRMAAIKRGAQQFNSRQVINIFTAYKKEAGIKDKPTPVKKDIGAQVQVVPSTTGSEGDQEVEAREAAKYATREEFSEAKNKFIKGRLSEADFNKVAARFQAAIRDKKVK